MFASVVGSVALILSVAALAGAGEVCVSCLEPTATYRCTFDQERKLERLPYADDVLQHVCLKVLAKAGGHARCNINRQAVICDGIPKTVTLTDYEQAVAGGGSDAPTKVEGLGSRAAQSMTEQLKKAGDAVGGTVKKSWTCLSSLFKEC